MKQPALTHDDGAVFWGRITNLGRPGFQATGYAGTADRLEGPVGYPVFKTRDEAHRWLLDQARARGFDGYLPVD